jgi:hypothetical protein
MRKLLTRLRAAIFRRSIVRQAKERGFRDWPDFRAIFASSTAIYRGAYSFAAIMPIEAELIEALASRPKDEGMDVLLEALADPNPILCGYAIDILDHIGRAQYITPETRARSESVVVYVGCARMEMSLGEMATLVVSTAG